MKWWMSTAEEEIPVAGGDGSLEEILQRVLVMTRLQDLVAWGRKY